MVPTLHGPPPASTKPWNPSPHLLSAHRANQSALSFTAQPSFSLEWGLIFNPWDSSQLLTYSLNGEGTVPGTDVMFTTPVSICGWNMFKINVGNREKWGLEQNAKVCAQHHRSESLLGCFKKNQVLLSNRFGTWCVKAFLRINVRTHSF